jgi:hypothetical protein
MPRARLARICDGLVFALIGLAFAVSFAGGIRIGRGWFRLTATDPGRLLVAAAAITLIRHLILRRPSLRDRLTARRARRQQPWAVDQPLSAATRREWLIASGVMAISTAWLLRDQLVILTGVLDRGDPYFSMWRLAWIAHQLKTDPLQLWNANIFYPAANTFAYSDATLLPGLLVAPLLWSGVPVAVAHGLLYVASFFAAGLAMFALARAVTGRLLPALVAGVLFGFYPQRISTYSHLEMQGVFLMPIALLFLLRVLERGRVRDAVGLGLAVALQTLWSLYLGAYLGVGLALIAIVRWAAGHFTIRTRLRAGLIALAVAAAVVWPYARPYWTARETVGERPRDEIRAFSAERRDFFSLNEMNRLYGRALMTDINAERMIYPGATTLVLAAAALVPPAAPLGAAAAACGFVTFDASLGVNGTVFPWLFDRLSGFRAFRVPARFGMVMGLCLTLLAALGVSRIEQRWPGRITPILSLALLALAAFELRPGLPLIPTPTAPPAIYAGLPQGQTAVLIDLPLPQDDAEYFIDPTYMYYSTFHWARLLNGYSGFAPAWYPALQIASREFPADQALRTFAERGVEFLAVHAQFYPPGRYREVVAALDARTDVKLVGTRTSREGEHRLYRLVRQ